MSNILSPDGNWWAALRESRRRRKAALFADIRMMVWAGLLAGLLAWQGSLLMRPGLDPWTGSLFRAPGPWEDSPRSEAIPWEEEGIPAGAARIVDGDTFWLAGEKIRIADIDAPETRARCASEAVLAARARVRLGELLGTGGYRLKPLQNRDTDIYGRKLRIVTRGGGSIGDQLVAEGLARSWTGRREPWC